MIFGKYKLHKATNAMLLSLQLYDSLCIIAVLLVAYSSFLILFFFTLEQCIIKIYGKQKYVCFAIFSSIYQYFWLLFANGYLFTRFCC